MKAAEVISVGAVRIRPDETIQEIFAWPWTTRQ